MAKSEDQLIFFKAREDVALNLEAILASLSRAVDEGMVDLEDVLYNQCLALIDDVPIVENWDEMEELIVRAKDLEQDVAAWLSYHRQGSISFSWPRRPKGDSR